MKTFSVSFFYLKKFAENYGEKLEEIIFTDAYLIEHFASNAPDVLIEFSKKYPAAAINRGDYLFHILSGLFSDKRNPIYAEIRQYKIENEKEIFLSEYWLIDYLKFKFSSKKNYKTTLPIISWLSTMLGKFPNALKEDTKYYLNTYPGLNTSFYNKRIFSEKEINLSLANDSVFNSIQLFRILLIEITFTNEKSTILIDRLLLLFYSSWHFVLENTNLESDKVALNNDSYTINEYQLKYLFHGYITLVILQELGASYRISKIKENTSGRWIIKELFSKIDKLISSSAVSNHSKNYYVYNIIGFYFRLPKYFSNKVIVKEIGDALIWQLKHSMTESPFGKPAIFQVIFKQACNSYEFYRDNNQRNIARAKLFYTSLLPFTGGLEYKIVDI